MRNSAARIIVNARLVLPEGAPCPGAVRIVGDRIAAIGEVEPERGDVIHDAGGQLLAPGLVDLGVFAIDKPAFHFGGITRAALMPDQSPPLDHPARVRFAAQSGKPDLWVHPLAAATRGLEGAELAELALMREAGARAGRERDRRDRADARGGRARRKHGARVDRRFGHDAAAAALLRDAGYGGGQPCRRLWPRR